MSEKFIKIAKKIHKDYRDQVNNQTFKSCFVECMPYRDGLHSEFQIKHGLASHDKCNCNVNDYSDYLIAVDTSNGTCVNQDSKYGVCLLTWANLDKEYLIVHFIDNMDKYSFYFRRKAIEKPKKFNDFAKAKWLKKKYEDTKFVIDLFPKYDPRHQEALRNFKNSTKIDFMNAPAIIKEIYAKYWINKQAPERQEQKKFIEKHTQQLF